PSLNILLKLMSVVALVIAPSIALNLDKVEAHNNTTIELHEESTVSKKVEKEIIVEVKDNGEKIATITTTTTIDGEEKVEVETLQGEDVEKLVKKKE
ncbi:MAG: sodium-translocating pyrophosphatase, partial [Flavobacteriaceae bacterium]|nr:sodium-translocating pyrophosphatase [Flavobacteriaceae bacterium]